MTGGEETGQAIAIIALVVFIGLPVAFVIGLIAWHLITGCAEIAKFFWWDIPKELICRLVKPPASRAKPLMQQPAPVYDAHGPDGSIIGTFDNILDAEICGLTAAGVKAVDLPLVLRERRRLGTYGSLRDPEPAEANEPKRPAGSAGPIGGPWPTWGERIRKAPDLRKAYPPQRLSDRGGPFR